MRKLVLILALLPIIMFGQTTVYINPDNINDPLEDGSKLHPYNTWEDIYNQMESNTTYLQKRGTVDTDVWVNNISGLNNVKIGAYGPGNVKPIIITAAESNGAGHPNGLFNIRSGSHHITIDSIVMSGVPASAYTTVYEKMLVMGVKIVGGSIGSPYPHDISITNCEIRYAGSGIISLGFDTSVDNLLIENCSIHDVAAEGIWGDVANATIRNCHLYNINMNWYFIGHTHAESGGDAIQLSPGSINGAKVIIEDNIIDRRETANKFAIIYATGPKVTGRNLIIRNNLIYPPKDTIGDEGGAGIFIGESADTVWMYGNTISGRGYDAKSKATSISWIIANEALYVYYNVFDSVYDFMNLDFYGSNHKDLQFRNNTFVGVTQEGAINSYPDLTHIYNNIFALHQGVQVYTGGTDIDASNNVIKIGSPDTWDNYFGFTNWKNGDFHINRNSIAHDYGLSYSGYPYFDSDTDITGIPSPQGTARDAGAYEVSEAGQLPGIPIPKYPLNQVIDLKADLVLYWTASTNADSYTVQISNGFEITQGIPNRVITKYRVSGVSEYKSFFWRVKAVNQFGESEWSPIYGFAYSNAVSESVEDNVKIIKTLKK